MKLSKEQEYAIINEYTAFTSHISTSLGIHWLDIEDCIRRYENYKQRLKNKLDKIAKEHENPYIQESNS